MHTTCKKEFFDNNIFKERVELLKGLAVFLLAFGVVSTKSVAIAVAGVLSLAAFAFDKDKCDYKAWLRYLIPCAVFILVIAAMPLLHGDSKGIKSATQYLDKMLPALLLLAFIRKKEDILLWSFGGVLLGLLYGDYTIISAWMDLSKRTGGVYGNPNRAGGLLAFAIPMMAYYSWYYWSRANGFSLLSSFAVGVSICALLLTGSRGALIGLCATIFAVVLLLFLNKVLSFKWCLLIAMAMMFAYLFILGQKRSYDMERVLLWQSSWHMFLDYPLLGIGLRNFNEVYIGQHYISPLAKEPSLNHPHNIFLYYLVETGIVGFTAFAYMLGSYLKLAWNNFIDRLQNKKYDSMYCLCFFASVIGMLIHGVVDIVGVERETMRMIFFAVGVMVSLIIADDTKKTRSFKYND